MKKYFRVILLCLTVILLACGLFGCNENKTPNGNIEIPKVSKFNVQFIVNDNVFHKIKNLVKNSKIEAPENEPIIAGYDFTGWFKDKDCKEKWVFEKDTIKTNTKIYAGFKPNGKSLNCELIYKDIFTYDKEADLYTKKVDNELTTIKLNEFIKVSDKAIYKIYYDSACVNHVPNLNYEVSLGNGDNEFYVKVFAEEKLKFKIFHINIRRSPKFKVTYLLYDAETKVEYYSENEKIIPLQPNRNGYNFLGWLHSKDNISKYWDFEQETVQSDMLLRADWEAKTIKVTFDSNGGTYSGISTEQIKFGTASNGIDFAPAEHEYGKFKGWYYQNKQITDGNGKGVTYWNIDQDVELRAEWAFESYDININMKTTDNANAENAGSVDGINSAYFMDKVTLTAKPNNGYKFIKWTNKFGEELSTNEIYEFDMPNSDVDIVAYFEKLEIIVNVTLDADGGNLKNDTKNLQIKYGDTYTLPIPEKEHYFFVGWFYEDEKLTKNNGESVNPMEYDKDFTAIAQWAPIEYEIGVKSNNAKAGKISDVPTMAEFNSEIKLETTLNDGYSFLGWFEVGKTEPLSTDLIYKFNITQNMDLEARFKPNTYKVTFDRNYGNAIVDEPKEITFGEPFEFMALTSDDRPTDDNQFEFLGWYVSDNGKDKLITDVYGNSLNNWDIAKDTVVYAKWKSIFNTTNGKITSLTGYGKQFTDIVIPCYVDGVEIIGIGKDAFKGNANLKTVSISKNIKIIDEYAFANCGNLESIIFEDNSKLTEVESYAFENCNKLKQLHFPRNTVILGNNCLSGCNNIENLTIHGDLILGKLFGEKQAENMSLVEQNADYYYIPNSLTTINITESGNSIAKFAFSNCKNITKVNIPECIEVIGNFAFNNCINLTEFDFSNIKNIGNDAFNGSGIIETGILSLESIGDSVFANSKIKIADFTNSSINKITKSLFANCCSLTTVIGVNGKKIDNNAFYNCTSLENFSGVGIKTIGINAFNNTALTEDSILSFDEVTLIGYQAFHNTPWFNDKGINDVCYVGKVIYHYEGDNNTVPTFNTDVESIAESAFSNISGDFDLTNLVNLKNIGDKAFYNTNISSIKLPDSVVRIGAKVFSNCEQLTNIVLGDSVKTIGLEAFSNCKQLQTIDIGTHVESINARAFINCKKLQSITLPDNLKILEEAVFENCISLTNVIFGHSEEMVKDFRVAKSEITEIKERTFFNNKSLEYINLPNTVVNIENYAFENCSGLKTVTFNRILDEEKGEKSLPAEDTSKLTSIGQNVFKNCILLENISIPITVSNIGNNTFENCENIKDIKITNVTYVSDNLFKNCIALNNIELSDSVSKIGDYAFYNCIGLDKAKIPNATTEIGDYAFSECKHIVNIEIPNGALEIIGTNAFENCNLLSSINIPNNVKQIKSNAFSGCSSLSKLSFSKNLSKLEMIGDGAFNGCSGLNELVLPNSLQSIDAKAFTNCSNLKSVELQDKIRSIGAEAFSNCTALNMVKFNGTNPPTIASNVFDAENENFKIYVRAEYAEAYKTQFGWSNYIDKIITF